MKLVFRCDATANTGLGHLSRCLALAEALADDGHESRFAGQYESAGRALLTASGFPCMDAAGWSTEAVRAVASEADTLVIDSYEIDETTARTLAGDERPLCMLDDFARFSRYDADVVINFTVRAPTLGYRGERPRWLLGLDYMLMRRALRRLRRARRPFAEKAHRVLVSLGGMDAGSLIDRVRAAVEAVAPGVSVEPIVPRQRVLGDLSESFAGADACISGGGLTKYEAAYVGVPPAVISRTDGEARETVAFSGEGLAFDLGKTSIDDGALREGIARFLDDVALRRSIHEASRRRIPDDPTQNAARALTEAVQR